MQNSTVRAREYCYLIGLFEITTKERRSDREGISWLKWSKAVFGIAWLKIQQMEEEIILFCVNEANDGGKHSFSFN